MMALIPCPECKKSVSEQAEKCPHCGVSLRESGVNRFFNMLKYAFLGAIFLFLIFAIGALINPKTSNGPRAMDVCREMIKMQSANPDNVEIDDIEGVRYGDEVKYTWTPYTLKLQNRYGAMVGASATCVINTKTNDVTKFIPPGF
ncbi:zinc ribbon domain-containing protein [Klebsiella pneumoniae]|uniref:zinc ribbon domain-containing protein n=1 Tax=Klebsiella pneumoniae TaxID=573 RepID=UPI001D017DED|nr:zinc ribbon domain-containing protein [Klebsiella pneumoniae]